MDDLISREKAFDMLSEYYHHRLDSQHLALREALSRVPPAEPEIIHCKDCKYYDGRPCGVVDYYNTESDFCSRAERRTDD